MHTNTDYNYHHYRILPTDNAMPAANFSYWRRRCRFPSKLRLSKSNGQCGMSTRSLYYISCVSD